MYQWAFPCCHMRYLCTRCTLTPPLKSMQEIETLKLSHTLSTQSAAQEQAETRAAPNRLGCYFCNDVVAPLDSTVGRALDQQCTV